MKKSNLLALFSLFSLFSIFCYADEAAPCIQETKKPHFYEYHNRMIVFAPFYQGYERIKPDAFYVGVEGIFTPIWPQKHEAWLINEELRMGYNFFCNGRDHVTPFAGAGYLEVSHHNHGINIGYGTLGFLYDHEFNTIFNLGLNGKILMGSPVAGKHHLKNWGSFVIGSNVSLPITFRFGHHRHWDFRIEPFNIYLRGSKASETFWGFANSIGYRF